VSTIVQEPPLLAVDKLVKTFGGFHALDGVSFHVRRGEVLGLVGPNGSGKTTCINVITGLYAADGGSLMFDGRSIGGTSSYKLVRGGINRTFQLPKPFFSLGVRENVEIAARYGGRGNAAIDVDAILASVQLDTHARLLASELNSVQQKMLDLARALATAPKLLCVDELAAGLNSAELDRVADRLRALAASGVALVVVEHLMGFLHRVTDRCVVLNAGREIFEGPLAAALKDAKVIEVFLGTKRDRAAA
jgi:branched-chain amino acid transport system ATP-binding protein